MFHIDYFFLLFSLTSRRAQSIWKRLLARFQLFLSIFLCLVFYLQFLFLSLSFQEIPFICKCCRRYAFVIIVSSFPVFREYSEIISFFRSTISSVLFIHGFTKLCAQMVCLNDENLASTLLHRIVTEYPRNVRPSYSTLLKIFHLFSFVRNNKF